MRLLETIRRDLRQQKWLCSKEQAKLERLQEEWDAAVRELDE